MSAPLVPSPLDYIGHHRFALYPAIKNAGPNEWVLGKGTWSEVQVVNAQTGCEMWIPRQHIGAVSDGNSSLLVVGLRKELDFRDGSLEPREKRVIEIPRLAAEYMATEQSSPRRRKSGPAPVVGIRLEDKKKSQMSKALIGIAIGALLLGLLATLVGTAVRF